MSQCCTQFIGWFVSTTWLTLQCTVSSQDHMQAMSMNNTPAAGLHPQSSLDQAELLLCPSIYHVWHGANTSSIRHYDLAMNQSHDKGVMDGSM